MKTTICCVLLLSFASILVADYKPNEEAIERACIIEAKVNPKEAHEFWEPTINFDHTTPNMKCQIKCVMEKMGHLKAGVFYAEKAADDWNKYWTGVLNPKAFNACRHEKGANDCETAFKIMKCMRLFKG